MAFTCQYPVDEVFWLEWVFCKLTYRRGGGQGPGPRLFIVIFFLYSVETAMNGSSHPNQENLVNTGYWEDSPPHGLSEPWRGKFGFRSTAGIEAAAKAPMGTAAPVVIGVWGHQPPSYLQRDFHGKSFDTDYDTSRGLCPRCYGIPRLRLCRITCTQSRRNFQFR